MKPSEHQDDHSKLPIDRLDLPGIDLATAAFERFDHRMDDELERLVALWQHLAAPITLRIGRSGTSKKNPLWS